MDQLTLETLPTDVLLTLLDNLDASDIALLSLCNKTFYNTLGGPRILRDLKMNAPSCRKFLQALERDLPINYVYCDDDIKFHYAEISECDDLPDSLVTFPDLDRRWICIRLDELDRVPRYRGPGFYFYQARTLLKMFACHHPMAQRYLEAFSKCQIEFAKPCTFLQRDVKVAWVAEQDLPVLLVRVQHWSLHRRKSSLFCLLSTPKICDHLPRNLPIRPSETFCVAIGASPEKRLFGCHWCGTEFRDNTVELRNPPRLHLSSYVPFFKTRYKLAACTTKWLNLGTLEGQQVKDWRKFAFVPYSDRTGPCSHCEPRNAFEYFEGEDVLAEERVGRDVYTPLLTKELGVKLKKDLAGPKKQAKGDGWMNLFSWLARR